MRGELINDNIPILFEKFVYNHQSVKIICAAQGRLTMSEGGGAGGTHNMTTSKLNNSC